MGDRVARLDRYEPDLGPMLCADLGDATPPEAMADPDRGITTGDLLLPASRDRLLQWMRATRTGAHRLRAAPAGTPARRQQGRHRTRRGNHQQVQGHRDHLPARQGPDRDRRPPSQSRVHTPDRVPARGRAHRSRAARRALGCGLEGRPARLQRRPRRAQCAPCQIPRLPAPREGPISSVLELSRRRGPGLTHAGSRTCVLEPRARRRWRAGSSDESELR